MNNLATSTESARTHSDQTESESLFMSSYCGVRGHGIFEQLLLPVQTGECRHFWHLDNRTGGQIKVDFHCQLQAAFSRARSAGIANPIAIGAIPFDKTQPAQITIPRSYEIFSRSFNHQTGKNKETNTHKTSKPSVVNYKSLPDQPGFKQSVQQIIANLSLSNIRKAVISRIFELELDASIHIDHFFLRLITQNPNSYHFRFPLGKGAEFIGASPELLIRRSGKNIFTNPLAGSAPRQTDAQRDRDAAEKLTRSAKDAYEHRLVVEDIRTQLQPLCRELRVPDTPQLMQTGTMWHLSTPIQGTLKDPDTTALQIACRLHPTPALCGFPTQQAHRLIQLVEPFDRGLFGGIVGWCDAQGNGEWAVAIRCGVFSGNRAQLFAGAGIVKDSDPEGEWRETSAKLLTILKALEIDPEEISATSGGADRATDNRGRESSKPGSPRTGAEHSAYQPEASL